MDHFKKEERAFAVECYIVVVNLWNDEFRKRFAIPPREQIPQRATILNWAKNFRLSANANDRVKSGRPRNVRTPENVEVSLQTSPRRSIAKRVQSLNIPRESIRGILRDDLQYHPYKMCVTQQLHDCDYAKSCVQR